MKELSIEEKAKAYDEAIKVANKYKDTHIMFPQIKDEIFPEFCESEDEEIRRFLIDFFKSASTGMTSIYIPDGSKWKQCLSWLEKHCEQKPVDKIEHERMTKLEEKLSSLVVNAVHRYCEMNNLKTPHFVGLFLGDKIAKDWSKEILESAKKELEEIEQKPAWSEKDETALGDALWCCKQAASIAKDENDMGNIWYAENWLKFLKDRVQPQNRWKPSDEQMQILHWCMPLWVEPKSKAILESLINDLEKLREE